MNTLGHHLLMEFHDCDHAVLNDVDTIEALLRAAAKAAQTTIVASMMRPFVPHGVSGVLVLAESHLSIHTWPESGYASVDLYSCGESTPEAAYSVLTKGLQSRRSEVLMVTRGMAPGASMKVIGHDRTGSPSHHDEVESVTTEQ